MVNGNNKTKKNSANSSTSIFKESKISCENYLKKNINNFCGEICKNTIPGTEKCMNTCQNTPIQTLTKFNIFGILSKSISNRSELALQLKRTIFVLICLEVKKEIFQNYNFLGLNIKDPLNFEKRKKIDDAISKAFLENKVELDRVTSFVNKLVDDSVDRGYYQLLDFILGLIPFLGEIILGIIKFQNIKKKVDVAKDLVGSLDKKDKKSESEDGGTGQKAGFRLSRRRKKTRLRRKRGIRTRRGGI